MEHFGSKLITEFRPLESNGNAKYAAPHLNFFVLKLIQMCKIADYPAICVKCA